MPIETVIDPARKVVLTTCIGVLTISEVAEACTQLARDPAFDREFSHLNDLTGVSGLHLSVPEMKHFIVQRLDPFSENSKRVFVASEPLVFGMARLYESLLDLPSLVVVRSMEEGRRLLELEPASTSAS